MAKRRADDVWGSTDISKMLEPGSREHIAKRAKKDKRDSSSSLNSDDLRDLIDTPDKEKESGDSSITKGHKQVEEIKEGKDDDNDSLDIGSINLSELDSPEKSNQGSSAAKSSSKELMEKVKRITEKNARVQEIKLTNELFTVKSYEQLKAKKPIRGLKTMIAMLSPTGEEFKDVPIEFKVVLRHSWGKTMLDKGDTVRVIGTFSNENNYTLNLNDLEADEATKKSKGRFLVLEPDILIPSTGIASASPCPRVPLLREQFKNAEGDPNYALTMGNVIHLIFQRILENPADLYYDKNETKIEKIIHSSIQDQLVSLYLVRDQHPESKVLEDSRRGVEMIHKWLDTFQKQSNNHLDLKFISQIAAEQEIHSTIFGVKGKIDSTCAFEDGKGNELITAVELKTGKSESHTHISQVMIYLMILDEVFKNPNSRHLLVYIMLDAKNKQIKWMDNMIIPLVQHRNILCKYKKLYKKAIFDLPPMIKDDRKCQYCFSKNVCCTAAISLDSYCTNNEEPNFKFFKEAKARINNSSKEYFRGWIDKISQDQIGMTSSRKKKSKERLEIIEESKEVEETKQEADSDQEDSQPGLTQEEIANYSKKIFCESDMTMTKVSPINNGFIVTINRVIDKKEYFQIVCVGSLDYSAKEMDEQAYVTMRPSQTSVVFTRGQITKKNYFKIDTRNKRKAIELEELKEESFIGDAYLEYSVEFLNEEYYNILAPALGGRSWKELKWEIKKEPFSNYSYSVMRSNIFQLVDNEKLKHLKRVIVEGKKPQRDPAFAEDNFTEENKELFKDLDDDQAQAFINSVASSDISVVSGAKSAGKSRVAIALMQYYCKLDQKVLLAGSRNEKIDDLLIKAQDKGVSFIRVTNNPSQINEKLKDRVKTATAFESYEEIEEMLMLENIYASTCLGCQNNLLTLIKPFDVCIVTHADTIKESAVLGAMILAKKTILIGTKEGEVENQEEHSLFLRLSEELKEETNLLKTSYID